MSEREPRTAAGRRGLTAEEAVEKALLHTFQLSNKDYRKMQTALSGVAFIRALEQDGYTVRAADPQSSALRAALEGLRTLSEQSAPSPWQWLDGDGEAPDELQDGRGEMVATGFREEITINEGVLNRDGTFAAAAVNFVRAALSESTEPAGETQPGKQHASGLPEGWLACKAGVGYGHTNAADAALCVICNRPATDTGAEPPDDGTIPGIGSGSGLL